MQELSPKHSAYLEVSSQKDIEIVRNCNSLYPILEAEYLDFRNELHATNDKILFKEQYKEGYMPLYKGATIHQYNSSFAPNEYWLCPKELDAYLRSKEINRLVANIYAEYSATILNKSLLPKGSHEATVLRITNTTTKEALGDYIQQDRNYYRIGWREIARDTDQRSFIMALLPKQCACQNKIWASISKHYSLEDGIIVVKEEPIEKLLFILALSNSILLDYILRFTIAIHVNKTYVQRLPFIQPTMEELRTNTHYKELIRNSMLLTLYNSKELFTDLQKELAIADEEIPQTQKQYDTLRAKNDCIVATLYNITKEDLEHILQPTYFKVLHKKQPQYIALVKSMYRG